MKILLELGIVAAICIPLCALMGSCISNATEEAKTDMKESGVFVERSEEHHKINYIRDASNDRLLVMHTSFVDEKTGRVCVVVKVERGVSVDCDYPKEIK